VHFPSTSRLSLIMVRLGTGNLTSGGVMDGAAVAHL
jgi:hypothetical protein